MEAELAKMAVGMTPNFNTPVLAIVIALLGLLIRSQLNNRKLTLADNKGLRQEFIDEMHALRSEVRELRQENTDLRAEVRELHSVIDGLRRGSLQAAISAERTIVDTMSQSEPMKRAMKTLDGMAGGSQIAPGVRTTGGVEGDAKA